MVGESLKSRRISTWGPALILMSALVLVVTVTGLASGDPSANPLPPDLVAADQLFSKQNFKEAREAYRKYSLGQHPLSDLFYARKKQLLALLRMHQFDDALQVAILTTEAFPGTVWEPRAHRILGNLYLKVPHEGTVQGGKLRRATWGDGLHRTVRASDRKKAIEHLERARELFIGLSASQEKVASLDETDRKGLAQERIDALFDLVAALARFTPYDAQEGDWMFGFGASEHDPDDQTVGETASDLEGGGGPVVRRPSGIPVDKNGSPIFEPTPETYVTSLPVGQKIKGLLREIASVDSTDAKDNAALARYRQAMLARTRYGAHRLQGLAHWLDGSGTPYRRDVERAGLHELADDEVYTLVGSRLARVRLPQNEDILALLRGVVREYPKSKTASEAQYAIGLYYQSRNQLKEALREFARLEADFPGSSRSADVRSLRETIERPEVNLEQLGVQLPDAPASLTLSYRNTDRIHFNAYGIDLERFVADRLKMVERDNDESWRIQELNNLASSLIQETESDGKSPAEKYRTSFSVDWDATVNDDQTHRYAKATLTTPLKARGCYVVEARIPGQPRSSRNVVLLQDVAVVKKSLKNQALFWVVNARTGVPIPGATLSHTEIWQRYEKKSGEPQERQHWYAHTVESRADENGISLFQGHPRDDSAPQVVTIVKTGDGGMAFHGVTYWDQHYSPTSQWSGQRGAVFTDRPVYRPDQPVRYKLWVRNYNQGRYQVPRGASFPVEIHDSKGNVVHSKSLTLDEFGGASDLFRLAKGCPLGMYSVTVSNVELTGAEFRVEEYKKPEFEVLVEPKTTLARLGEKVEGTIRAKYYFGAPVTDARVTYRIFRQDYTHRYTSPGHWDWLYGWGYGRCYYPCEWLDGWGRWGGLWWSWCPWWGTEPSNQRELISEGEGAISSSGEFAFTIDTAPALANHPDLDHRYFVEAEVVDKSRRVITGSGSVKVTRQEYYVFVENDRGHYQPGQQIVCKVKALTANDTPVASSGRVIVSRIRYPDESAGRAVDEPERTFDAKTDSEGNLEFTLKADRSGQFKVAYETTDSRGKTIAGAGIFWVLGDEFKGSVYRFNDLEVVTDKRTYRPGEVARLMINCNIAGSTVLLSVRPDAGTLTNYRLVHLPGKSSLIELPIEKGDVPNFFVEATVVTGGQVHQEMREVVVPPEEGVVELKLSTDKADYRPGSKATIRIQATAPDGKPVKTQVALSVFDRSVLYIQPELAPDLRSQFWGQKRTHSLTAVSNLDQVFHPTQDRNDPLQSIHSHLPQDWNGSWSGTEVMWKTAGLEGLASSGRMLGAKSLSMAMDDGAASIAGSSGSAVSEEVAGGQGEATSVANSVAAMAPPAPKPAPTAGRGGQKLVAAHFRSEFEDTAHWVPDLVTDEKGEATTSFAFPENLTTWKIRALGLSGETRAGDGSTSAITTKKLILRLQAPRFFVERDRVILSANIHNYLATDKKAKVTLKVPPDQLEILANPVQEVSVKAGGETRVDWDVTVRKEGLATIEMEALTDEESDAVRMAFPTLVHGLEKTVSKTAVIQPSGPGSLELELDVPAERRPEASRLEVRFSPTLAGAAIEALPYLLDYPYGCTEQTMSRFLPAVLVQRSLVRMGINLADLKRAHTNLDSQTTGAPGQPAPRWQPLGTGPVYDQTVLNDIVKAGLDRIYRLQLPGGGWGWWANDTENPYLTSYVSWGLILAQENDVAVDQGVLSRGLVSLKSSVQREMPKWKKESGVHNDQAFVAYVLSLKKEADPALLDLLFERRIHLSLQGKAQLSLALRHSGDTARADLVLQNIRQYEKVDGENQTTWYDCSAEGWWFWWNNDIETHAWILRAIIAKNVNDERAPGLVKWLLNNRKNGTYWRSTRDTALAVGALVDTMRATREDAPDYTVRLLLDGKELKKCTVNSSNMLNFDNRLSLTGNELTSGRHTLRIEREGKGAVYLSSYLTYFTKEEGIGSAGLEVKVERSYFKLERADRTVAAQGSRLEEMRERQLRYNRVALKSDDILKSGDLIEVELKIVSKNEYDYLVFEDPKPAGCEPVDLTSGSRFGELCSNMELRDDKVAFFVTQLSQGEHLIRYRLRAEIPGRFHVLPTRGFAMYAPDIRANAAELILGISEK